VSRPAGVVLAAGAGARLRPLTALRPKALCPVGGVPLIDLALARLEPLCGNGYDHLAVNAHHLAEQVVQHCGTRVHVSVEGPVALGTAGALGALRDWLDGRDVLVTNADAYLPGGLAGFADGWDGERCRLLCTRRAAGAAADFIAADGAPLRYVGACLLPGRDVAGLRAEPSGLYEALWRDRRDAGLDLVEHPGTAVDCGTAASYLRANLHTSGGAPVIGAGALVHGRLTRSVVWDGAWVGPEEHLVDAVRAGDRRQPVTVFGAPQPVSR
jgi:hypothetical protein